MFVTAKTLAQILRLSERRLRELNKGGILTKDPATKKYDLSESVGAYIDYKIGLEVGGASADYFTERALHERAKRQKAELSLEKMQGKLHEAADVERVMTNMLVNFRDRMRGLPSRISPMVVGITNAAEIESLMLEQVDEALLELSDYDANMFNGTEDAIEENEIPEADTETV